jgi:hypothetical protein
MGNGLWAIGTRFLALGAGKWMLKHGFSFAIDD